jgi:hypothetical protein
MDDSTRRFFARRGKAICPLGSECSEAENHSMIHAYRCRTMTSLLTSRALEIVPPHSDHPATHQHRNGGTSPPSSHVDCPDETGRCRATQAGRLANRCHSRPRPAEARVPVQSAHRLGARTSSPHRACGGGSDIPMVSPNHSVGIRATADRRQ